jgi:hypothetical protein
MKLKHHPFAHAARVEQYLDMTKRVYIYTYIYICIYIYSFAIVHLGAFCIENAPTLVATRFCPVATGAHSGCNLFTSGCN